MLNFEKYLQRVQKNSYSYNESEKLMWQEEEENQEEMSWYDAKKLEEKMEGWRLPTKEELAKANMEGSEDFIYRYYWSSDEFDSNKEKAWFVDFEDREHNYQPKKNKNNVRFVKK